MAVIVVTPCYYGPTMLPITCSYFTTLLWMDCYAYILPLAILSNVLDVLLL